MVSFYTNELDGQYDFYTKYLPLVDNELTIEDVQHSNVDGQIGEVLIEMKLNIVDINTVAFQAVKYLSALRIKGTPVPSSFILIDLNNKVAYLFESEKYRDYIEQVYVGSASVSNIGFSAGRPLQKWDYGNNPLDQADLVAYLKDSRRRELKGESKWFKVNLDENNIVGWATSYYQLNPKGTKGSFIGDAGIIGEIRSPDLMKKYILPYEGKTNIKFGYLMDRLNDNLKKKNLGAFFTPPLYARKSHELVYEAIRRHQESGKGDYIILDRCAGTGNLQLYLNENVPDDIIDKDVLSHVILNTYEYYEYKVLLERLGDKVRYIIPPVESEDTYMDGLVRGSNALSQEFIEHPYLQRIINDEDITIIVFENPPYAETTSAEHQRRGKGKASSTWKKDYVIEQMKSAIRNTKGKLKPSGYATNDMGNAFIWSAFEYYLRFPTDSYIVYSPVKYWKAQNLVNKRFLGGYGFNRRHFHTNINAFISCVLWSNEDDYIDEFELQALDIVNNELFDEGTVKIERVHSTYSKEYFDKGIYPEDEDGGILCGLNGLEYFGNTRRVTPIQNPNILGYMAVYSSGFDNPDLHSSLLVAGRYDGNGFFLRSGNFLEKLPMFAASRYITYNSKWTERSRVMKSADGSEKYFNDVEKGINKHWLLQCLFFTCLEPQNHMRSFMGTDERDYRNQLTLGLPENETIAYETLKDNQFFENMNKEETDMFNLWNKIMEQAIETDNFNPNYIYGLYQIDQELNTSYKIKQGNKEVTVYDYPELNGDIRTLKSWVREYYNQYLTEILFNYKFIV